MRDYLELVRRCLLRRDAGEARRLLAHPFAHALPRVARAPVAELAAARSIAVPLRALRYLREMQLMMVEETEPADSRDPAQLELGLDPPPWSRTVSLSVARAARHEEEEGAGGERSFALPGRAVASPRRALAGTDG